MTWIALSLIERGCEDIWRRNRQPHCLNIQVVLTCMRISSSPVTDAAAANLEAKNLAASFTLTPGKWKFCINLGSNNAWKLSFCKIGDGDPQKVLKYSISLEVHENFRFLITAKIFSYKSLQNFNPSLGKNWHLRKLPTDLLFLGAFEEKRETLILRVEKKACDCITHHMLRVQIRG